MRIPTSSRPVISSIVKKLYDDRPTSKVEVIDSQTALGKLNSQEKKIWQSFYKIDPASIGFKGPLVGIYVVPSNIVTVKDQTYQYQGVSTKLNWKFVPSPAYDAYSQLNRQLQADTGRVLLIDSGYRSPAAQLITFLRYLVFYEYDLARVGRRVALPGYSEHGDPVNVAIDFINTEGIPNDSNPAAFADTLEYQWLIKNARRFGFHLSYPEKNKFGVDYEPWHWRFSP